LGAGPILLRTLISFFQCCRHSGALPISGLPEVGHKASKSAKADLDDGEPRAQLGLRYMPVDTVDVDFIYGQNLTGRGTHWLTVGLTPRTQ
jgi:hypothetical protein